RGVEHRHPADPELGGQLVFRGQLVAGLPAAGQDLLPQLVKDLLADAALDNFFDGHRRTLLCKMVDLIVTSGAEIYNDAPRPAWGRGGVYSLRSEEHTSELQSRFDLVCRLLLDKNTSYPS